MSTISIILTVLIIIALPALIARFLLIPLEKSPYKVIVTVVMCLGACALMAFLIILASLPSKTGKLLDQAVEYIETETEKSDPGYLDTVLDKQAAEDFLSDGMYMSSSVGSDKTAEILLEVTRLKSFKKSIDALMQNAEAKLAEFDSTAFTPRNIIEEIRNIAFDATVRTAGMLGTVLIIISLIFYAAIALIATGMGKGWFKAKNSSLNFGGQEE